MSKKKWLWILLAVLLAISAVVLVYWDTIVIYTMPKSVLTKAVYTAMADLQSRYEQSPVSLFLGHVNPEGQYTARMKLETENELLGPVSYDMSIHADVTENLLSAEGIVATSQNDLDLSVYLDRNFMALSSEDLLGGAYYGITYETFPEDIRAIPLLSMFIGESILSEWDSSVANIQGMMNKDYQLPEVPEISSEEIRQALSAILLLPGKVKRVELPVWGEYVNGYRIDYSARGEQVGQILDHLMDTGDGSDAQISATFYLYENQLVMMQLQCEAGGNSIRCALELMFDTATRTFRYAVKEQGKEQGFCLRHEAESQKGYLHEAWTFYQNFEAKGEGDTFLYRWEPVMGELAIDSGTSVTLNVFETENGLHVQTEHFERLMAMASGKKTEPQTEAISCSMILQNGAKIATPVYKNIRDWSLEDLLVLLGGVGSLFGLDV